MCHIKKKYLKNSIKIENIENIENIQYFRTKIADIYPIYINYIYRRYISSQSCPQHTSDTENSVTSLNKAALRPNKASFFCFKKSLARRLGGMAPLASLPWLHPCITNAQTVAVQQLAVRPVTVMGHPLLSVLGGVTC